MINNFLLETPPSSTLDVWFIRTYNWTNLEEIPPGSPFFLDLNLSLFLDLFRFISSHIWDSFKSFNISLFLHLTGAFFPNLIQNSGSHEWLSESSILSLKGPERWVLRPLLVNTPLALWNDMAKMPFPRHRLGRPSSTMSGGRKAAPLG